MNKDMINGSWREIKGKIQQAWGRLTDDDLQKVEGNFNELSGKLQKVYGYTKEEALAEVDSFKQKFLSPNDEQAGRDIKQPPRPY